MSFGTLRCDRGFSRRMSLLAVILLALTILLSLPSVKKVQETNLRQLILTISTKKSHSPFAGRVLVEVGLGRLARRTGK